MNATWEWFDRISDVWWSSIALSVWQSTVVGLAAICLVALLRRWPSPVRYWILVIALVKFAVPPLWSAPTGLLSRLDSQYSNARPELKANQAPSQAVNSEQSAWLDHGTESPATSDELTVNDALVSVRPVARSSAGSKLDNTNTNATSETEVKFHQTNATMRVSPDSSFGRAPMHSAALATLISSWKVWLMLAHFSGIVLFAVWIARQLGELCRLVGQSQPAKEGPLLASFVDLQKRLGLYRAARLLVSGEVRSPLAFGILRPTVVVPATLYEIPCKDAETILAHELAHLRRGDAWMNWTQLAMCVVWWFHPVVWLINGALRRTREDCCDDLLLADKLTSDDAYCQTLLVAAARLNGSYPAAVASGIVHRRHPLTRRLKRIMDQTIRRRVRLSALGAFVMLVVAGVVLPGVRSQQLDNPVTPQQRKSDVGILTGHVSAEPPLPANVAEQIVKPAGGADDNSASITIAGLVQNQNKQPVPHAQIWLIGGDYETQQVIAESKSNDEGRFDFANLKDERDLFSRHRYLALFVRDGQRRLGWLRGIKEQGAKAAIITVHAVADLKGRFVDLSGQPIGGTTVQVEVLGLSSYQRRGSDSIELPEQLSNLFSATTAVDGTFTLHALPANGCVRAKLVAEKFGSPSVLWDFGPPITIRLGSAGSLNGQLALPAGESTPKDTKVSVRRNQPPGTREPYLVMFGGTAAVVADGSFSFPRIPPGQYSVDVNFKEKFYALESPTIQLDSAPQVANISLPVGQLVKVSGRVVEKETGRGVPDAEVSIYTVKENRILQSSHDVTTDTDGRYQGYTRAGDIRAVARRVPGQYLTNVHDRDAPRVESTQDVAFPDITLEKSTKVEGVVVNDHGDPVAGADIHLVLPDRPDMRHGGEPDAITNVRGQFILKQMDPIDILPIRAAAGNAVTDGAVIIIPKDLKGPLRVSISEKHAFRIRGQVVNQSGKPIPDAQVVVTWQRRHVSKRTSMSAIGSNYQTLQADSDGKFQSRALWPGDEYSVIISRDGYSRHQSKYFHGAAGKIEDVGTIKLTSTSGFAEGRVVDSADRPLNGVRVFNSGDALELIESRTDASGKFRLEGLPDGRVYAFAEHSGYRFSGIAMQANSDTGLIRMFRPEEPTPGLARAPQSFEMQQQIARRMIERMWNLPEQQWKPAGLVLMESLARIDLDAALGRYARQGGRPGRATCALARQLLRDAANVRDEDFNEALTLLSDVPASTAFSTLQELATQFGTAQPAKSLRLAEEAALRARQTSSPDAAYQLAEIGALLIRLGKKEAGQKLLDEAIGNVEKLDVTGRLGFVLEWLPPPSRNLNRTEPSGCSNRSYRPSGDGISA